MQEAPERRSYLPLWPIRSRSFFFQVRIPLADSGEAVHARTMCERTLCQSEIGGLAVPRLLWRRLQGAAVGESEPPGNVEALVDGVQMCGRVFVRLSAGKKSDSRHRRRHAGLETLDGAFRHFLRARLFFAFHPG